MSAVTSLIPPQAPPPAPPQPYTLSRFFGSVALGI
ncbi:MAG TPA: amino acid ABC transporter permease, partial [Mycoplana sp.]|nr:amino acid ABC transporter permease [Mycoplana sp.]